MSQAIIAMTKKLYQYCFQNPEYKHPNQINTTKTHTLTKVIGLL